ncbi:peptidoglycan endopeptidase LytF [Bacillus sp. cl95]|nr:LysM peptidoglycan-binding domain-containing protein [Bacillus sp. UNCCL13]SFA70738.1 peptidoglycan endopeptidase LytF [Bacillus sp. UNCCL13]SFQ60678.1 peptidoglycan endopeptidase LytF [Bacillus sp. cl95]
METFYKHKLIKSGDGYILSLYLHPMNQEFSEELGAKSESNQSIEQSVKQYISKQIPNIKIKSVQILLGTIVISCFSFTQERASASTNDTTTPEMVGFNTYTVQGGDSLSVIAKKYGISIEQIKEANNLVSDVIRVGQTLTIPKGATVSMLDSSPKTYTVVSGDSLSVIAKRLNTSVEQIKAENQLESDLIRVGQVLVIPTNILENPAPTSNSNPATISSEPAMNSAVNEGTYIVVAGDTLWNLSQRFGTSISNIKQMNNLSSDTLTIGQKLAVPSSTAANDGNSSPPSSKTAQYTVVSGDSLSVIAKKYSTTVDHLKTLNNLNSDVIRIGQVVVVPELSATFVLPATTNVPSSPPTSQTTSYTVVSGDSLSVIAKRFNTTVDSIRSLNNLTSDIIRVGQKLTINGTTGSTTITSPLVAPTAPTTSPDITSVQKDLNTLGYYAVSVFSGVADTSTEAAVEAFQKDYGLAITGKIDSTTKTEIEHAIVKKNLVQDTKIYTGVPYKWGGTTPTGFDCSGFVYFMFNKQGVEISRNTSEGLYMTGKPIAKADLKPGDLVFFGVVTPGKVSHVGIYTGGNNFVSATSSKGIWVYSIDDSYWGKYYMGAKRIY